MAAPRAADARVWVNGDDYGLYLLLETPDDRFLKRAWDEPDGNLYDGKYVWYPDGSYTLLDFAEGHDHLYQLEEGEDVGHADIASVSAALAAGWGSPTFLATTGAVVE
ncbi:MAG: CotH kinase family protein, partial [bacterium]